MPLVRALRRIALLILFAMLSPGLGWAVILGAMQPWEVRDLERAAWRG